MSLDPEEFERALGERPVRVYPALLATDADAQAWARAGAPQGAVVVSGYQVSPRGRAGIEWDVDAERDLVWSMVVRPHLSDEREGWLYLAGLAGLVDHIGDEARVVWPDQVAVDGEVVASLGWHVELGPGRVDWAVLTVWLQDVERRAATLAQAVDAVEARLASPPDEILPFLRQRCVTLGERVRALLIPMGPAGPRVEGEARDLLDDGSLLISTSAGGRIPVTPQGLGRLEPVED